MLNVRLARFGGSLYAPVSGIPACGVCPPLAWETAAGAGGAVVKRIPALTDRTTAVPSAAEPPDGAVAAPEAGAAGVVVVADGGAETATADGAVLTAGIAAAPDLRACEPVPELAAMPPRPEPPTGELEESTSSEEGDAVEIAGKI
jgi:hypothetical protein